MRIVQFVGGPSKRRWIEPGGTTLVQSKFHV